jgi:hypothetical protein
MLLLLLLQFTHRLLSGSLRSSVLSTSSCRQAGKQEVRQQYTQLCHTNFKHTSSATKLP